jgi:hypothetical protein
LISDNYTNIFVRRIKNIFTGRVILQIFQFFSAIAWTSGASGWKLAAVGLAFEFVGPVRFGSTLGAFGSKPGALVVFDSKLGVLVVVAGAVAFGWRLAAFGSTLVALDH